jgi:hypothetical protein
MAVLVDEPLTAKVPLLVMAILLLAPLAKLTLLKSCTVKVPVPFKLLLTVKVEPALIVLTLIIGMEILALVLKFASELLPIFNTAVAVPLKDPVIPEAPLILVVPVLVKLAGTVKVLALILIMPVLLLVKLEPVLKLASILKVPLLAVAILIAPPVAKFTKLPF